MSKILVFGHQNPDTDAIGAAIAFANLQKELGKDAEAVALGEPNEETAFALNHFGLTAPRVVETVANEVEQVMLVDHNEFQQSAADIEKVEILAVVDHHRIANFQTANPLYYRAEPVGCTSTIILKLYKENNVEVPKNIAGMMLSAIVSDTLLFKSPTCTQEDVKAAKELAEIAGVDLEGYGLEMLKAGTNLGTKSASDLIDLDAKSFPMGGSNLRIAQVNTVDLAEVFARQAELESAMQEANTANGYDLFVLVVTNILDSDSEILIVGEPKENVEKAFNVTLDNNRALLKGVVSRKKQVVPQLTAAFEG
ncbi:manganese-dependent inorganic pyrophosphatase [Enterococcus cecorum]|uniref:Probable manganese-dependent inorganic pyrophosphatase n=1 Tax=Enterococcus cecorum DSM 20682 = ATCC 43198 TaxID=1121864 RepID=S1R628_9ENTE|nr:manganese-dependent inorganic pyrophosphatase [Enterococcus cecorum]EOX18274.1 manganese-dependent inorganic pyrophosphatase [Enterococcus cecorum DSM 20682 = ATCC 43198]ESK61686.1 manganese-dependent inorganic pyrophosphatase [Enterococcus cecorum DSM 20682 = ATCC 43198]CAI3498550.1 manganese-dependent inorganic pyrophosphatase [Enterococcus cecorum DSM 20682 = ATCC 43198]SQE55405.1 manganese-dependent inorganic pyrophosphatase [Enterococcus cecorum]STP84367.1 manganese-dependent inorganic